MQSGLKLCEHLTYERYRAGVKLLLSPQLAYLSMGQTLSSITQLVLQLGQHMHRDCLYQHRLHCYSTHKSVNAFSNVHFYYTQLKRQKAS